MFGRRKRKSQEEEEDLLVPHGLIWQATDEPREPDSTLLKSRGEVDRAPSPDENRPAISVVPPSRVSTTQQLRLTPADSSPARLGAISPPIPWPSAKTTSVIRRIPPPTTSPVFQSATRPSLTEPQRQPQPVLDHAPTAQQRDEVEVLDLTTTAQAAESSLRETMTRVLQSVGQRVGSIHSAVSGFWGLVRDTARNAYQSINLRPRLQGLKLTKEKCVGSWSSRSGLARQSFQHWSRSNLSRMARMKLAIGRFSSEISRSSRAGAAHLVRRIRNHKLHIRIVKPAHAHELIRRSRLAWAEREDAMRRQPRLWMSMTMAALSAMLTLGVISAVSHYAPGADASNKAVANPSQHNSGVINPKPVVRPRTSARTTQASGSTRSVASAQAKPASAEKNSTQTTATRRAPRNSGEDYVAPNTYHYYGMNGKSR